jgi:hypothetical protein
MVAQTNRSRLNGKQHRSVDAIIPTERASFHPKELKQQIVEIHCCALICNNLAIAAKVMAMEGFFQNPECRGDSCPDE